MERKRNPSFTNFVDVLHKQAQYKHTTCRLSTGTHPSQDIKGGLLSHCDGYDLPSERNRHGFSFPEEREEIAAHV